MKRKFYMIIIIALLFILQSCARNGYEDEPVELEGIHGLLTRVEHGDNVAYIFGSLGDGSRLDWFPLNPIVYEAMERADVFVFDTDPRSWGTPSAQAIWANTAFLPEGVTLAEFLPSDVYAQFIDTLATYDASGDEFIFYYMPSIIISGFLPFEVQTPLDVDFFLWAGNYMLEFALDNEREIIDLIDNYRSWDMFLTGLPSLEVSAAESLVPRGDAISLLQKMVEAYEAQNVDLLYEAMRARFYNDTNLYIRHMRELRLQFADIYTGEIDRLMRDTDTPTTFFIIIDIDFMIGDDYGSVINNLRCRGLSISELFR